MQTFFKKTQIILIIALCMTQFVGERTVVLAADHNADQDAVSHFPDQDLLQQLIEQDVIRGDGSGDYALDRSITRAEWLTLLKRMLDKQHIRLIKPSIPFKDYPELESHWASEDVSYWIQNGVVLGDSYGKLRLDEPITLAELLVILDRITSNKFVDEQNSEPLALFTHHWAYPSLNRLYTQGWIRFDEPLWEQSIEPDRLAKRGEGLLLLSHFYDQTEEQSSATKLLDVTQLLDQPLDVNGDGKIDFSFRFSSPNYTLKPFSENAREHEYLNEKEWIYDVQFNNEQIGQFRFQLKQAKEQDFIYFIRYTPTKTDQEMLSLDLIYYGEETLQGRRPISAIGEDKLPYDWEHIVIDQSLELPHASLYLQNNEVEFRVGATDTFRNLGYTVRDHQVVDQTDSYLNENTGDQQFTFTFTNKVGYYSETWGMLASRGLFDWERNSFDRFMLQDDVSINRKLSLDGLYYRTPYNYVPRTTYSYYLNPANIAGVRAVSNLQKGKTKGRYIDDFVILLGQMAVDQQNEKGFWPTEPKSEWLEQDYGIGYKYFDNRRNADNVTFLLSLYQHYPDEQIKITVERHLEYLFDLIENHSVRTSENGLLFTDYIGDDESDLSHIALNHHLAVINLLIDWYMITEDAQAKSYALRMVEGLEDTTDLWIKENKDLYYALFADLTPHHYPDYIDLTLSDLKITQRIITNIVGQKSAGIQNLIESKQQWLDERLNPSPPVQEVEPALEEEYEEADAGIIEETIEHSHSTN